MSFLYPSFLWALLALAIPIIIHLFNFRRYKTVYFTNVRFLKEVKEETTSRSKLKHIMVLLSRLGAVAFLVFAFAQPFIPREETEVVKGNKAVSLYVDNSFSMNALSNDVSLFEKAKKKATEIVQAYGETDEFNLITNDFEGKHQRLFNKEEVLSYLDDLQVSPNVQPLSSVLERQKQVLNESEAEQKNVFLLSDFQKNIVDLKNDTSLNMFFIPLQAVEQQNVFIDSVWFESPVQMLNQPSNLLVRINNTGQANIDNSRLTLKINDQTKALKEYSVQAKSTVVDTLTFTITEGGWHNAELNITDYPITMDDSYFFTFDIAQKIGILAINQSGSNSYLNALFKEEGYFKYQNQSISALNYSTLGENQLIVLNELKEIPSGLASELESYLKEGGSVLILPSLGMNKDSYNNFLRSVKVNTYQAAVDGEKNIDFINVKQEIFKDVFEKLPRNLNLPSANKSFPMTRFTSTNEQVLLRYRDGSSCVSKYSVGNGKLYLSSAPMDNKITTLPSHAIFAPMVYKMALVGGQDSQLAYTIGEDDLLESDNAGQTGESVYKLKGAKEEFIPGQKTLGSKLLLSLNNQLKEAGIYRLFLEENSPLAFFGFNFDRQESILEYFTPDNLKEQFAADNVKFLEAAETDLSQEVGEIDKGWVLWKWCILAALGFLLLEIILLRFLKQ